MALWKCLASGNFLKTTDEEFIIKEMSRHTGYERVTEEVKATVQESIDGTHLRKSRKEK